MKENSTEQMNASEVFCPNVDCQARGKIGEGNIVIHGKNRPRYRCKTCGNTFSAYAGTMFEGLRKPKELIVIILTRFAYGCPIQAIVQAFGLDDRTVASWRDRAGTHCQQVHQAIVQQGQLDLLHVQADEIRVKGCKMIAWMGEALRVSTRLWLGGVVSLTRDRSLADRLLSQVRACCQPLRALLVCTDGWNAYPGSIRRAFRKTGQSDSWTRASLFAGVASALYRHGHQTDAKETGGGSHAEDDPGSTEASPGAPGSISGRSGAQYGLYRTLERHHARATRQLNTQMSTCGQATRSSGKWHVVAWLHVQFLLAPS